MMNSLSTELAIGKMGAQEGTRGQRCLLGPQRFLPSVIKKDSVRNR